MWKIPLLLLGALFLLYFATSSGGFESGDAISRYETAKSLWRGEWGALPPGNQLNSMARGRGGKEFSSYGLMQSLLMLPGIALTHVLPISEKGRDDFFRLVFNLGFIPLLSAISFVILYFALLELGYSARIAWVTTFTLGVATPLWHYSRTAQEENLLAFAFALWLYGIARGQNGKPGGIFFASVAGCIALFTRWAAAAPLIPLALVTAYLSISQFRVWKKEFLAGTILAALTLGVLLAYNRYRFGSALETGYGLAFAKQGISVFHDSQARAIFNALLFSPYRGLFLYCPTLVFVFWPLVREPRLSLVELAGVSGFLAMLLLNVFYAFWHAGGAWGPRFLIAPLVLLAPLFAQFFVRQESRVWWKPIVALSIVIQILSVSLPSGMEDNVRMQQGIDPFSASAAWPVTLTAVDLRPRAFWNALKHTFSGETTSVLPEELSFVPNPVESDYSALFFWPVRFALRFHLFSRWVGLGIFGGLLALSGTCFWRGFAMASKGGPISVTTPR